MIKLSDDAIRPKRFLRKEDILDRYSSYELFKLYIPNLTLGKPMLSPLRSEKNPSFSVFRSKTGDAYLYKDHSTGQFGDIFKFLQVFFNETYVQILSRLCYDLDLQNEFNCAKMSTEQYSSKKTTMTLMALKRMEKPKEKQRSTITIEERNWEGYDISYWLQFGIKLKTLKKYNVVPISTFSINGMKTIADKLAYAYKEEKDGKLAYKIYQPLNRDNKKWRTSQDASVWQGWSQLPNSGDILIITKSLKDVMAITELTDYPAVSLQSETTIPKEHVMAELLLRFTGVFLVFDNDFGKLINPGQVAADNMVAKFPRLINYFIPSQFNSKDFSDFVESWGAQFAKKTFIHHIENNKPPF